ncbi:sigma-70 family RNA polymerase sigma factor [Fimbriimonas ginsengisoli]|uniref:RNA polymerase, sigma-24 subunit, ECF subfamily n=1 Tax=Fimbriimonas ginsengisoli Gsoil 348 TaxID=661478 RepID=A0A068NN81_FIMGI|nr:sigma-70 family RNA polymerase sigma factor [Fimbriimonas ginsengisoli]AIE84916.1 RNA polymerase, sigma-24 subunit, ECF subfamily [Fimbriimonas ginsengisoli Gsoil 348]
MFRRSEAERYREIVDPNLDAAYGLAFWLLNDHHDAEDAVQSAALSAYQHLGQLRGEDGRRWFLKIVRNTCMNEIRRQASRSRFEVDVDTDVADPSSGDAEAVVLLRYDAERLRKAIESLPPPLREVIVLREFEEMTYRDIAEITGTVAGTVMSRLSRARNRLLGLLQDEVIHDL